MPILFAVVSRGTTVLAKHAACAGNFMEVVDQVLVTISPEDNKLTYSHSDYLFHYVSENRIIYLCITDDNYERSRAFHFLNDIKRRFQTQYGDSRAQTALPYAMNSEFSKVLSSQIRHHSSEDTGIHKVDQVQCQVDELKDIMVKNIDQLAERGEKLELLVDKTDNLNAHAVSFRTQSRSLARSLWWKNVKIYVIIAVSCVVLLYIIVSISCGGLTWKKCIKKS